jgi:hypothetical protein
MARTIGCSEDPPLLQSLASPLFGCCSVPLGLLEAEMDDFQSVLNCRYIPLVSKKVR